MPARRLSDYPTVRLALILGLHENRDQKGKGRLFQRGYKLLVVISLFFAAYRRVVSLGTTRKEPLGWRQTLFDPGEQLVFLNFLFFFSGGISAVLLHFVQTGDPEFSEEVVKHLESDKNSQRKCFGTMILSVVYSLTAAISGLIVYEFPLLGMPRTPPLFSDRIFLRILEFYMYFLCQNTMNLLTAGFVVAARMVKEKIIKLQEAIKEDTVKETDPLSGIRNIQLLHQDVLSSRDALQEKYCFPLLYVYAVSVPAMCFMISLVVELSLLLWTATNIGALMFLSFSAFSIHEEGERLVAASVKLYNQSFSHQNDLLITHTHLLLYQIQSTKLTLSACNYFYLKKEILLALFSTILTNLLILVQFSKESH